MEDIFLRVNLTYDEKTFIAEKFLDRYEVKKPQDIYRWLWEGEFGSGTFFPDLSLERLQQDIRHARMHNRKSGYDPGRICEDVGLTRRFMRVNLMPYADSGCPLKRLIMLTERMKDARPDPLRFKKDWSFMKAQIVPGMYMTMDMMNNFENEIAFHMAPEVDWSPHWEESYGMGYRLVPRLLFFQFFPEFNDAY